MINAKIEDALQRMPLKGRKGKVNAIITSPPFPLVKKKKYGNETGDAYITWLKGLAPRLAEMLTADGSIVIEIGNAWVKGIPEMSTLPLEALLAFKTAANLHLCQHIICHNTARLPSPAQKALMNQPPQNHDFCEPTGRGAMSDAPWRATPDGVVVACRLTPKGRRDAIDGAATLADGTRVLLVRVRAVPENGKANDALLRLIADKAGAPASRARLVSGAKSRLKQVAISGDPAALIAKLEQG